MKQSAVLTVRLPSNLKKQMGILAEAVGRTQSYLAFEAIRQYIELQAWQVAEIKAAIKEADAKDFASERKVQAFMKKWGVRAS